VLIDDQWAYVQWEKRPLSPGHVIVVPRRHVADFFDMTHLEQTAVVGLLNRARQLVQARHSPDGYNIGVNVGRAAGQTRMHVHVHLIPRYAGDVANPAGGIRCVLAGNDAE
jgi:diadenosine tetraphosphate (Ap4A) HIT family hydrolase